MEEVKTTLAGQVLSLSSGKLAQLAEGSVLVSLGETVVLVTAVVSEAPKEGVDFLPLLVDFEERLYAAGKISGSRFIKREGRASESAVLSARLVDRAIRPLFPKGFFHDVQIVVTVLSADLVNDPDTISIIGASAALQQAGVPLVSPIGAVRVGLIDGRLVLNPSYEELEKSQLDLVVAGTKDKVVMLEAGGQEVPEGKLKEAIRFGHQALPPTLALQEQLLARLKQAKNHYPVLTPDEKLYRALQEFLGERTEQAIISDRKSERNQALEALRHEVWERFVTEENPEVVVSSTFAQVIGEAFTRLVLDKGQRPDGRQFDELRAIRAEVGVLPRPHGSALFSRGETQALTTVTLGSVEEQQFIDTMELEGTKRYMHHYNFPPYSVNEISPIRGPGRREIGHGALAEKALLPMIPDKETFPYTIRVVSEILASNGSTSMASVCGSSLALMDAGVPIKKAVAGVACGLVVDQKRYQILTDIAGIEDFNGSMDFKLAGTDEGMTALQMDLKLPGISLEIVEKALMQARQGRMLILDKMRSVISSPRRELSPFAPKVLVLKVKPEKIREVIGPGGKMINQIIDEAGGREVTNITIEQDGSVYITSHDSALAQKAKGAIEAIVREVEVGQKYRGKVTRVEDYGAFVELLPGKEGLVHISQLNGGQRSLRADQIVKVGDLIPVTVIGIDNLGRINLSYAGKKLAPLPATSRFPRRERG